MFNIVAYIVFFLSLGLNDEKQADTAKQGISGQCMSYPTRAGVDSWCTNVTLVEQRLLLVRPYQDDICINST